MTSFKLLSSTAVAAMLVAAFANAGVSHAAEPIVGDWKTESGETANIDACGSAYCITLKTGQFAGKRIGRMSGSGGSYKGTITDPSDDKEYSGSAKVNASSMKLKGCALKIFCKTQNWSKL